MRLSPGSLPWLVLWDLRIRIRALAIGRLRPVAVVLYSLFAIGMHAAAGLLLFGMLGRPMTGSSLLQLVGSMLLFLVFFMLMAAMLGGFQLTHAGRELTSYLGSPLPFARIVWMRVLSLVVGTWSAALLLAVPIANMGAILGHPVFLLIYPVTFGLAIAVSAVTLIFVAVVLRTLGVQRARRVLQLLQALVPLAFVLLSVSRRRDPVAVSPATRFDAFSGSASDLMAWPARALTGEWVPLLVLAAVSMALLWVSVRLARVSILAALQAPESGPSRRAGPAPAVRERFGRSLFANVLLKEWRTILRDPRLATSLLVQPLIVMPFFYFNLMHGRFRVAGAAAAATFASAQMSQFVANLMISAEEAPALLGAAPVARGRLIRYKCLAAMLPVGALMLLPALWLLAQDQWVGAVALVGVLGAGFCACAIEVVRPYPAPRRSFAQLQAARRRRDPLDILGVVAVQLGWTAGVWFLASRNLWGAAIVFGVLLVPFLQWWRDANRQSLLGY